MAEENKQGEEITILGREEIVTYPKINQPAYQIAVTYATKDLPPKTIFIPKEEYSKEKEAELIKKDIEERRKTTPETLII